MMRFEDRPISLVQRSSQKRMLKRVVAILCVVTILFTVDTLKHDADTLERIAACGMAEHIHDERCVDETGAYICGQEAHIHTDACYQQRPQPEAAELDGAEAPVDETEYELSDLTDESAAEIESAIGEQGDVVLGDDAYADEYEQPTDADDDAAVEEPVISFADRDYLTLSEMALPLQLEEVFSVLEVIPEDEDALDPILRIEKVEQDYIIIPSADFSEREIAVETSDGLFLVKLTDGSEVGQAVEEDTAPAQAEADDVAETEEDLDEEAVEITVDVMEDLPEAPETDVPETLEEGEDEAVTDNGDAPLEGVDPAESPEDQEDEESPAEAAAVPDEAVDAREDAAADQHETEEDAEQASAVEITELDAEEEIEPAQPVAADDGSGLAPSTPVNDAGNDPTPDVGETPAARTYTAAVDLAGISEYPLSLRAIMEAATEETSSPEAPEETGNDAGDDADAEDVIFETAEETVEVEPDADAEDVIFETVEETVEAAPDADAEVVIFETAEETVEVEPDADDEVVFSVDSVEAVPIEVSAQLGDVPPADAGDPQAPNIDEWTILYDDSLLSVERAGEDHALTPIADFAETVVTVDNGAIYTITLLNASAIHFPAQSFAASTDYVEVAVLAPEGAFPEGTTMAVRDIESEQTIDDIAATVAEAFVEIERVHAVDISFYDARGAEIEPLIPISVVMTAIERIDQDQETVVVHVDDAGEARVVDTSVPAFAEAETLDIDADVETVDGYVAEAEAIEARDGVAFMADAFSVYALVVTKKLETKVLASDGGTYRVEVSYGPDAGIPDGAVLAVEEVTGDGAYLDRVEASLAGNQRVTLARFFDIRIMESDAADAAEVQPLEAVQVSVTLMDAEDGDAVSAPTDEAETADIPVEAETADLPVETVTEDLPVGAETADIPVETTTADIPVEETEVALGEAADGVTAARVSDEPKAEGDHIVVTGEPVARAAHFGDELAFQTATEDENAVVFTAEGFSVWGVVYTVDFYYGDYEWHINGGGYMSLAELVSRLGIAEDGEAFADAVREAVFSAPELLSVSRADADTTVGAIKAALGLECETSARLTEAALAGIDATEVRAGDWALISLKPFQTHETLTLTLADGAVYQVKVEDAETNYRVLVNKSDAGYLSQAGSDDFLRYVDADTVERDGNDRVVYYEHLQSSSSNPSVRADPDPDNGYEFVFWLIQNADGSWRTNNNATLTYQQMNTNNGTHIAFFAKPGDKVIVRPEPTAPAWCWAPTEVHRVLDKGTDTTLPKYSYTSDRITYQSGMNEPTDREKYEFLGWFNGDSYLTMGYDKYDKYVEYDKHYIDTANLTSHTILIPKYELKQEFRDYYYVYFDGTNGINAQDGNGRNNTLYSRISGTGAVLGAQDILEMPTKGSDGKAVVTLPAQGDARLGSTIGSDHTRFELKGWYMLPRYIDGDANSGAWSDNLLNHYIDVSDGESHTVTIERDTVFYADWFPVDYNIGKNDGHVLKEESTAKVEGGEDHTVYYRSTKDFITTEMFDYNSLFNMASIRLGDFTVTKQGIDITGQTFKTRINSLGNYEYWNRDYTDLDFMFISAVSDDVRSLSPYGRKVQDGSKDKRNESNEINRSGKDVYSGIIEKELLDSTVKSALFDHGEALGKRFAGTGDMLYLYDDDTGYYYYDSDKNAASFNAGDGRFYVYDYTNKIDKSTEGYGGDDHTDFLPFNYGQGYEFRVVRNGYNYPMTGYSEAQGDPNYWFGMKSEIEFFLPNDSGFQDGAGNYGNRSVKDDEMVFKFSGDDDVWVCVDDQPILDMGGVHGKVYGEINFSRGTWTVASAGAAKVYDDKGIMTYALAPEGNEFRGEIDGGNKSFASGHHKLTIYYLERGSSQSNCAIYFNIAPQYTLKLRKEDAESQNDLGGARFEIYQDAACTQLADVYNTYYANNKIYSEVDASQRTRDFTTGSDSGLIHISGFYAGRTYYIKELQSPDGYPDVSDKVIRLTFDSSGNATFLSTLPDVSGTYFAYDSKVLGVWLTIPNRKSTDVTVRKVWRDTDGNVMEAPENAKITLSLHRYKLVEDGGTSPDDHTVQIVVNYLQGADGSTVYADRDATSIVRAYSISQKVSHMGSIAFTVEASNNTDALALYSAGLLTASEVTMSERYFGVGNSVRHLPIKATLTQSDVTRDMTVYLCFIGDVGDNINAHVTLSQPTVTAADGSVYGRVETGFIQTEMLPVNGEDWEHTWTGLEATDTSDNMPYYYYVTEDALTVGGVDRKAFYTDMYSSHGVTGGTIEVTNQYETVLVKLRKRDASSHDNLSGAKFKIYTSYDVEHSTGTLFTPREGYVISGGNADNTEFTSDSSGNFYVGYLPLGTYYLVETQAPRSYNMLTGPVEIVVSSGKIEYKLPGDTEYRNKTPDTKGYINIYIDNTAGFSLPETGGPGTTFCYILGLGLILLAIGLLMKRRGDSHQL